MEEEGLQRTANELIHIGSPIRFDTDLFQTQLQELMAAAYDNDENIVDIVKSIVTTYTPKN